MYGFVNRVVGEILRQVTDIEKSPLKYNTNSGGQLGFIQLTALVAGVQSIKIRRQLGRLAAFILLKKIAHKFNAFTLNL